MTTEVATVEVDVEETVKELQTPKYLLKLGTPVTQRWTDKDGVKRSQTYPGGTELGVIFPFKVRRRNQKWADCITPDGKMLTIGHNKKHQLIEIAQELPIDKSIEVQYTDNIDESIK